MERQNDIQNNQFYLEFQPIAHISDIKKYDVNHFEILLRTRLNNRYPEKLIDKLITCEEKNRKLVSWYAKQLKTICMKYPQYVFNYNIHPQQFIFKSTWLYLNELKPFANQIHIEITEKILMSEVVFDIDWVINKISDLGFKVSIDDVLTGQNSLELVMNNIDSIFSVKFSLQNFKGIDIDILDLFLNAWVRLTKLHNIKFIVEGIEDEQTAYRLFENGISWQQGYYWGKAKEL